MTSSKCNMGCTRYPIGTHQESRRARLQIRVCKYCGSISEEPLPVKTKKPSEGARNKLRQRAQTIAKDVRAGRVTCDGRYWRPVAKHTIEQTVQHGIHDGPTRSFEPQFEEE